MPARIHYLERLSHDIEQVDAWTAHQLSHLGPLIASAQSDAELLLYVHCLRFLLPPATLH
ncbi:hypothetical protein K7W42_13125 [Deinococcus sp. HMF7604]|uniref:hypothetical protein n=1 Tax=Deinococcus betulae TaxID=2873312 RepID=UPI001CCA7357|nr:hypothetical protein [Deinococcus betulae]MBZ9751800.1 hypothetical protein [Deinococcus betulae]